MLRSGTKASLRVCLVAENCLVEAFLRQVLRRNSVLHVIGLKQYIRLSPRERTNTVFIVDQCGLKVSVYECIRELQARSSKAKFLILDDEKSTSEIVQLLIMGVQGYIRHVDVPRTLVRAIFSLSANQLWVPHEAFQQFLSEAACTLRCNEHRARQTPTAREEEILELVRRRLSNREIGESLHIRVSTVKFHLSNILSKMNVSSRRELIDFRTGQVWKTLSA